MSFDFQCVCHFDSKFLLDCANCLCFLYFRYVDNKIRIGRIDKVTVVHLRL